MATENPAAPAVSASAEAGLWSHELLEEILSDIASTDTLPQRCPSDELVTGRVLEPLFDELASKGKAAFIANTIRGKRATCRVLEVKTLQQHKNGSCGYYALHNAILVLSALRAPKPTDARVLLEELQHRGSLWRDFSRMHRRLQQRTVEEACPPHRYPWGERVVRSAVLERSHLMYLLKPGVYPELTRLGGTEAFTKLSELDWETACSLHEVFSKLRSGHHTAHAFILGDWNHWFALVAHRTGAFLELVVLDSLNRGVTLLLDDCEKGFASIVNETNLTSEERRMAILCRENACNLVKLIARCIMGEVDIRDHCVANVVNEVLHSFDTHCVQEPYSNASADLNCADRKHRLLNWISNFYPPPVIHTVLREVQTHSDEATRSRVQSWARAVREIGLDLESDSVAEVLRGFNKPRGYFRKLIAEAATCSLKSGGG
eukprot:TRINITY_DN54165_c0_g1_i1.p1 TRINITY_DN54165_c0_g1~~TRINITY_DN54165_c0_g1_i1.p1  ORF type:complete len:434 (-),score=55.03 TRINITY_DN54165_c0_g1_i1:76-1377(-)